ncbi:MAG: pantothenate kinase [Alphaproteobacteria bacterium]|nr:pantothenate kinase [Alphaproteobacteria bacterium]|tara:strand:- start:321 stop:1094 length:774 start_codon:yes stop_codon:yes gene_type:complete
MLLTVDYGNTNTVFAVFDGDTQRGQWRIASDPQRTADEYAVWLTQLMSLKGLKVDDVNHAIVTTVVPGTRRNLTILLESHFGVTPLVVRDPDVDLGIEIMIERPEQAGADRLVAAVGAHIRYPGDLIVIDFGTATTFDVIDSEGNFGGGVIAPGINLSVEALYTAGALLPRVSIERPDTVIGGATVPAMQSGIFWGYVSMIEGMVPRIAEEYGKPMKVVATGGLASLFADVTDVIDATEPDLTLIGLREIARRNGII